MPDSNQRSIQIGSTSNTLTATVYLNDGPNNGPGSIKIDLAHNTPGISIFIQRIGQANGTPLASLSAKSTPATAHADGQFLNLGLGEISVDCPNEFFATYKGRARLNGTFTGGYIVGEWFEIVGFDPKAIAVGAPTVGAIVAAANSKASTPPLERNLNDTNPITFQWLTDDATITGQRSLNNADYADVAGTISFLRTEGSKHLYTLAYNAADRPAANGIVRYAFTDGTYTRYVSLRVSAANVVAPLNAIQTETAAKAAIMSAASLEAISQGIAGEVSILAGDWVDAVQIIQTGLALQTTSLAIKTKTDKIPNDPASVSDVQGTVGISIPAIEAESILLDQEVVKYRGTLWTFLVNGLTAIPQRAYWTIKRGGEPDAKSVMQVLRNEPTADGDGLKILAGAAVAVGNAARGSIAYESYEEGSETRYRAILTLLPDAAASIMPDVYRLDFKDVTSNLDSVKAEAVLRVVNPVTLSTN